MNVLGLVFGYAVARGRPDASKVAIVGALPNSPVMGLLLATAVESRDTATSVTSSGDNYSTFRKGLFRRARTQAPAQHPSSRPAAAQRASLPVHARGQSADAIEIEWVEVAGADSYQVRRNKHLSSESERVFTHPKDRRSFSDGKLDSDAWYTYVVEAVDRNKNVIAVGQAFAHTQTGEDAKKSAAGR